MARGLFTQCFAILFDRAPTIDEIAELLDGYEIVGRAESAESVWMGGESITIAFRPDVNGLVTLDVVEAPWPDHMGDPQKEPDLFAAWTMGNFGPGAFPGNLERAVQQSWGWSGAQEAVGNHSAFVRLRSSYVLGAGSDAPIVPSDYDPEGELNFLTAVTSLLLQDSSALAYFTPSGEVLRPTKRFEDHLEFADENRLPCLDLWANVRMFNPGNGWLLMDTVGMSQLDTLDVEVCFPDDQYDPDEMDPFLRNISLYLLQADSPIQTDHTIDGPGSVAWRALECEEGLVQPPRRTLRLFPEDGSSPPVEMRQTKGER